MVDKIDPDLLAKCHPKAAAVFMFVVENGEAITGTDIVLCQYPAYLLSKELADERKLVVTAHDIRNSRASQTQYSPIFRNGLARSTGAESESALHHYETRFGFEPVKLILDISLPTNDGRRCNARDVGLTGVVDELTVEGHDFRVLARAVIKDSKMPPFVHINDVIDSPSGYVFAQEHYKEMLDAAHKKLIL